MSQATIGNLRVNLGLDTAEFRAGAKKAESTLAGLSNSLKGFGLAIAGTLSLAGIATGLKSAVDRMDELGKAAQKIGVPVEQLSQLEYAARLADVPLAELTSSMGKFARSISEIAAGGSNDAGQALQALGVSATDAQGRLRPTLDIMLDLADEFSSMKDGADKTAISMALFGKSGADMIPLLNGGRQAIADAANEARAFGLVVTQESSKAAEQFNDNLTRLMGASQGLQQQLAIQLVPTLADLSETTLDFLKTGEPVKDMVDGLKDWFGELTPFIETTRKEVEMITGALQKLGLVSEKTSLPPGTLERLLPGDVKATNDMLGAMLGSIDGFGAALNKPAKPSGQPGGGGGSGGTGGSGSGGGSPEVIPISLADIRGPALELSGLTDQLKEADLWAKNLADNFTDGLSYSLTDMAFNAKSAGEAMDMLKRSALDALQGITEQLLKSGLSMMLGNLGTAFGGAQGLAGFGGFYANGGTLGAGKWGIAGEAGPEIIHGPARITPMDGRRGGGANVTIINNTPAKVSTRTETNPDGSINIKALISEEVLDTLGGGKAARLMGGRFGARIQPRRT